MLQGALPSILRALDGWAGLIIFLLVGLAFPLYYYGCRATSFRLRKEMRPRRSDLRTASLTVLLSAVLCFVYSGEIYLYRHVADDRHMYARMLDWFVAAILISGFAPIMCAARLQQAVKADRDGLETGVPSPRRDCLQVEAKRLVSNVQARSFAGSTWRFLFTLWFLNLSGGLLTACIGQIVRHDIEWWRYPVYNVGGHVAMVHAVVGVAEALFHPLRVEATESAMVCETEKERRAHWARLLDMASDRNTLVRMLWYRGWRTHHLETGPGPSSWRDSGVYDGSDDLDTPCPESADDQEVVSTAARA